MLTRKKIDNKVVLKRVTSISLLSILSLGLFYVLFSPVIIATTQAVASNSAAENLVSFLSPFGSFQTVRAATSDSVVVSVVVGKEVMVTAPNDFALSGTIDGISGGTATGNAAFSVLGNSETGFNMSVQASTTPALGTGSYYFADYVPLGSSTPDPTWTAPAGGTSSFGFSVTASGSSGADAVQKFKYDAGNCNEAAGANSATNCWVGFTGTSPINVVSTSAFSSTAIDETINFKAAFTNDNVHSLAADTYQATVTATVANN